MHRRMFCGEWASLRARTLYTWLTEFCRAQEILSHRRALQRGLYEHFVVYDEHNTRHPVPMHERDYQT